MVIIGFYSLTPQDVFELIAITVAPLAQHLNDRQEGFSRRSQRILGMRGQRGDIFLLNEIAEDEN